MIYTYGSFEDYLHKIEELLYYLQSTGFNVNTEKYVFYKDLKGYLGFYIT